MLSRLEINDFALIENAVIDFRKGFTVLSGETGAGKSILIDAIGSVCGERANRDLIRTGKDTAFITAVFENADDHIANTGLDGSDIRSEDGLLIISREITTGGKSFARINGRIVPLSVLKSVTEQLIDIHGQNENQSLFSQETQLALLDRFGVGKIGQLLSVYTDLLNEYKNIKDEMKKFITDPDKKERILDLLKYQLKEIHEAKLMPGEDEKLDNERKILSNAEKINSVLEYALQALNGEETLTAIPAIKESAHRISVQLSSYEGFAGIADSLEEIVYRLEDISTEISDAMDKIDADPGKLALLDKRIDLIEDLKQKYGGSLEEIKTYYDKGIKKYDEIIKSDERVKELEQLCRSKEEELHKISGSIFAERKETASVLEKAISEELEDLGMKGTVFRIDITHISSASDFRYNGQDTVEFMISPNRGEELRPLARIASGGESSRIMLAIKTILAESDKIPVLIFDEIDTGISGHTANLLAEKLVRISGSHQVLCVTHMAQIASKAHNHIKLEKSTENERTYTRVTHIEKQERIDELARLLSGGTANTKAVELAKEMLGELA